MKKREEHHHGPAMLTRSVQYPYGHRVPRRIKMLRHVVSDIPSWVEDDGAVLETQPFIAYPSGYNTRRLVDDAFRAAGIAARPAMEIGRPDVMVRLVEAGVGVSVLPRGVLRTGLEAGTVICPPLPGFRASRALGLLRPRVLRADPLAEAFARQLVSAAGGGPDETV